MKHFTPVAAALAVLAAITSCNEFSSGKTPGELRWRFADEVLLQRTKTAENMPDTDTFLIEITDASGRVLYKGAYRDSPESLSVDPGSYTVSAKSDDFNAPEFDKPIYGDEKTVVVKSGESVSAVLDCSMTNAGVCLKIDPEFLDAYPEGVLFLKSTDGRLMYSYSERRTAYFNPGIVSLVMTVNSGPEQTLLTRTLAARDLLTLHISVPAAGAGGTGKISIEVDTVKNHIYENFVIGESSEAGKDKNSAIGVAQAKTLGESADVWIHGYIVGGDLTSAGKSVGTGPTFSKDTHLAIAARTSVTEKASCIAVELKSGRIRDGLNLVANPSFVGRHLYIKGDLVSAYFGTTGLKNVEEFELN